jgi:hypothetical protein
MKNKLLLLSFGLLMTTQMIFSQVPSFVPSNGLVGYWGFSGNANDQSGNGNNGSVNGAILTTDRFGNSNSAYSFDGISNYIQTNYQGVLGNNFRTISFWAKSNSTSEMAAFSYGASSGTGNRFDGYFNFNGLGCTVNIAGGAVTYSTPSSVNDNNWHNYIYVVDQINSQAISVKIYQDGNLLTTAINTYNPNTPINTVNEIGLRFGKTTYSGIPSNFNGKIDDIGFWNRALNQQEITNMYNGVNYSDTCNAVSGSLVNGLVGYWPFCGNANDQSGNGLNGVVNGATLTADRFGNNNSSYLFNNNSRIKINYNNSLNSTIGAISAWIKVNSLPSDNDPQDLIFGKGWGYPQLIIRNNGKIYLEVMNSQSTATFIESSSTITIGNWCHIFGFYSSNNFKLYINGVLDNSITPLPTPSFIHIVILNIG